MPTRWPLSPRRSSKGPIAWGTGVLEYGDRMAIVAPVGGGNLLFVLTSAGTNAGQLLFDLRRHRPALAQLL